MTLGGTAVPTWRVGCGRGSSDKRFELYQVIHVKIARRASARVANTRPRMHSRLSDAQNDSATALSKHVATRPTDGRS